MRPKSQGFCLLPWELELEGPEDPEALLALKFKFCSSKEEKASGMGMLDGKNEARPRFSHT